MKFINLTLSFLLASFSVFAANMDESEILDTSSATGATLKEDNFQKITALKNKIDDIDYILENFAKCEAKNMAYLGENVKGADSDNCVNIQAVTITMKSKEPKFKGFIDKPVFGTLTENKSDYDSSLTNQSWHRTRADILCKNKYSSARAMTYHDLKFMHDELPITDNYFDNPGSIINTQSIWVFDAEQAIIKDDNLNTRFASTLSHNNCRGWSSHSIHDYGIVIEVNTYLFNPYLKYTRKSCNNQYLIACVGS